MEHNRPNLTRRRSPLDDVGLASLPISNVSALAPLRTHPGLEAHEHGERLWLRWQAGDERILPWLLPLAGLVLYTERNGVWHRLGQSLPAFDAPPTWQGRSLSSLLSPSPVQPVPAPSLSSERVGLRLVRDTVPRSASALRCPLTALARWADFALTADLETLRAAHLDRDALVLGDRLPPIADGQRFWGRQVLTPLGFRPDPLLPESALRELLGLLDGDVALLLDGRADIVPAAVLQPLTRAGIRRVPESGYSLTPP